MAWAGGRPPKLPDDVITEYMGLLADVSRRLKAGEHRCLAVSGAGPGAGTTATVLALAHVAQTKLGWNVLAVEMNQRSPVFRDVVKPEEGATVAAIVEGKTQPAQAVTSSPSLKFDLVAFGQAGTLFSGLQLQGAAEAIRRELQGRYDAILFDTPPITSSADFFSVARAADGALLVVEFEQTRQEVLERVNSQLQRHDLTLTGTVLNKRRHVIPAWAYRRL